VLGSKIEGLRNRRLTCDGVGRGKELRRRLCRTVGNCCEVWMSWNGGASNYGVFVTKRGSHREKSRSRRKRLVSKWRREWKRKLVYNPYLTSPATMSHKRHYIYVVRYSTMAS